METEREINQLILEKTMEILEKYPELSEFLNEMPVTLPNNSNPKINIDILRDYYDSLNNLLKNYLKKTTSDED